MNNLAVFDYNGQTISRRQNGFINLTQMCQANGKRLDNWTRLKQTQDYIRILSQCLASEIVYSEEGVNGGTWGHPSLAEELQRWLDQDKRRLKKEYGYIYIFEDNANNAYKIGFTTDLKKRHNQHKTSNPFLELVKVYEPCVISQETIIHEKLKRFKIKNTTEWYKKDYKVLKIVDLLLY
jgi:predicted GIY-YIG superfamily endonuclease